MTFCLSQKSLDHMKGIDDRLIAVVKRAIEITPIDFGIPLDGGLRTADRQNQLFKAGKSKADGYIKLSNHQSGRAVDVFAYLNGYASWDAIHLAMIASAMMIAANELGIAIKWGGTFGSSSFQGWDKPHFELML